MNDDKKKAIAFWKLGVLGPLISARLEHGDRRQYFKEVASRIHQMPDGSHVELSARTIEEWYYAYKKGDFKALFPKTRSDRNTTRSLRPEVADLVLRVKREKPRRSVRQIRDLLGLKVSQETVRLILVKHHLNRRPEGLGRIDML